MQVEIDNLKVKLNKKKSTATVVGFANTKCDIFIPRFVIHSNKKYKIISIDSRAFPDNIEIDSLTFADDSEITELKGSGDCHIKKLHIPASITSISEYFTKAIFVLEIKVSPKNKFFKSIDDKFLIGKSDEDSSEFDKLLRITANIEDAIIPSQIKEVGDGAFQNLTNLKSVIFPEDSKLETLCSFLFHDSSVQKLVLPETLRDIRPFCFSRTENLVDIEISPKNQNYMYYKNQFILGKYCDIDFNYLIFVRRDIEDVVIPSQIVKVALWAIQYCKHLKSLTFEPGSKLELNDGFLMGCFGPRKVVFPPSIKNTWNNICDNNEGIEFIEFQGTSLYIGPFCFQGCSNLKSIAFTNATKIKFGGNLSSEINIYVRQDVQFEGEKLSCESRIKPIEEYFQLEKETRQPTKKKEESKKDAKNKDESKNKEDAKSKEDNKSKKGSKSKEDAKSKEENKSKEDAKSKEDNKSKEENKSKEDNKSKKDTKIEDDSKNKDVNKNNEENNFSKERIVSEANLCNTDVKSLIKKYDKNSTGKLEFDEFLGFIKEAFGIFNASSPSLIKQVRFLFDGMDVDGSHSVDQREIIQCFENLKAKDFKYITKLIFRGADVNNDKKVSIDELKDTCENFGEKSLCPEEFETRCITEFGKSKKSLEYWEFYKIITGETLDKNSPDYDPYEGMPQTESKCCILI